MRWQARAIVLAIAGVVACGRGRSPVAERAATRAIHLSLDTTRGPRDATILVTGLREREFSALRANPPSEEDWPRLFRVSVVDNDAMAVAGRYVVTDTAVEFHPLFTFDAGRSYAVRFDAARLPVAAAIGLSDTVVRTVVALPARAPAPPTTVLQMFPTSTVLPENQLRFYLEFSAPMTYESTVGVVHLLDAQGHEVADAFLPFDANLWNAAHTRYTLFFDPGRVKRGIRPNRELGRAIRVGRDYTIVVDARWRDAYGRPLAAPFRHRFHVGPPDESPIVLSTWKVRSPRAGSRDALVVIFPKPLDYALLKRALGVAAAGGKLMAGDVRIDRAETEWHFTPPSPWRAGRYELVVLPVLEDPAGNRIGRAFEIEHATYAAMSVTPERYTLPVTVR